MDTRKTINSIFMIPTLKIDRKKMADNNFINAYSRDVKQETQYKDAIYALFKPSDLDIFRAFLEGEYERTDQIIEDYDYPGGYVVVVYKLDPKFKKDFELVRLGKYSLTSEKFQELFPKTVSIIKNRMPREEISLQFRIFNKTEDLVDFWEKRLGVTFEDDQEVWYGFDEDKEVLNVDKIKEHV